MRDQVYTLLAKCRDQFRFYAVQHQQKNPPQEDKARVNAAIADEIEAQLNIRDPDNEHATMVAQLQKPGQDILKNMTPRMAATVHMGMGICTEAGELNDALKRWAFYGKQLDRGNVVEELGDLFFYAEGIMQNLGITREEVLLHNIDKLTGNKGRYKDGYSDAAAIARADKQGEEAA